MPDPSLIPLFAVRMVVDIQGPPVVSLAEDIISIRFNENLAQHNLLEVTVNNWSTGSPPGYKYSEGNLLHIGASFSLYSGDAILASGTITALAPSFPKGSAPTLMFSAEAQHPPMNRPERVLRKALVLTYGAELIEFHPVLRNPTNLILPAINATGMTMGLPVLIAGTKIEIAGVGTTYSGVYSVTETTHTMDNQSGYQTGFVAEKV
jgi:hypothetical protein